MSQITINEVSNNFTYSIGDNSYATVALPITSCWGPGFFDPKTTISDEQATELGDKIELELEGVTWKKYAATQAGIESFVADYRGPAAGYRLAKDYSYYMAVTLLTAGYDVLVCRLCPGTCASTNPITIKKDGGTEVQDATLALKAKYPGTFGNQLLCALYKPVNRNYWNLVTYVKDAAGVKTSVENIAFVFDAKNATDSICTVDEIESQFVDVVTTGNILDTYTLEYEGVNTKSGVALTGGTDRQYTANETSCGDILKDACNLAMSRFYSSRSTDSVTYTEIDSFQYMKQLKKDCGISAAPVEGEYTDTPGAGTVTDTQTAETIRYREWVFNYVIKVYDLLKDKLSYNPNRLIAPGWDDMDMSMLGGTLESTDGKLQALDCISPIHLKLMECAYYSRCATAYLDIPRSLARKDVYNESDAHKGYAQMLSNFEPDNSGFDVNSGLYSTHSALFAPWAQYKYVGTAKYNIASPSFLALMIQRSMVLNQSAQYEWIQPSSRKHNVKVVKPEYTIPKKVLDAWQPTDQVGGTGVNVITDIPGMGICLWGNQTLFNNPPATYQALRNLSTRHLVCAIEDVVYKAGIRITFQYNNQSAYSSFHAAVCPLLDTMVNCGALEDYYVTMNHDLDALGMVKANSVVGKIYLVPEGVIDQIEVDLIALPPGTDLTVYA